MHVLDAEKMVMKLCIINRDTAVAVVLVLGLFVIEIFNRVDVENRIEQNRT